MTNDLPRGIKLQLQLYNEHQSYGTPAPVELIVPILVLARTNVVTEITAVTP